MRDVLVCSWRHIPSLWVSLPTVKLSFLDAWATRPGALKQSASRRDSFRKWTLWVVVSDGMVPVVTDTASSFTVVVKEQKKKKKKKTLICFTVYFSVIIYDEQTVCVTCVFYQPGFLLQQVKIWPSLAQMQKKNPIWTDFHRFTWVKLLSISIEWANTFDLSQSSNRC